MEENKQLKQVERKIIVLRDTQVILDRDIAELYGVATRDVNKAVKNNPDKLPQGYIITLEKEEKKELVENFHRFNPLKHSTVLPKAFTEKGLYMLATIIKSTLATETTLAIIETFTKLRQLARAMQQANDEIAKGGELPTAQERNAFKNLMDEVFADPMPISVQRMTFGVNLGFFKWELETTRERKGESQGHAIAFSLFRAHWIALGISPHEAWHPTHRVRLPRAYRQQAAQMTRSNKPPSPHPPAPWQTKDVAFAADTGHNAVGRAADGCTFYAWL